tara:strand:- start:3027 stop:3698 length:672 start_codon:yes stop_codon:yes gene_type:complete
MTINKQNKTRHTKKTNHTKKEIKNKTKKKHSKMPRKKDGHYYFKDYPEFKPNLSPREMFKLGSFGGTYWRPIKSKFYKNTLKNYHKKYPKSWWKDIDETWLTSSEYNKNINKYREKVGTSLKFWEKKGWIKESHPYGWVEWYCDFFMGKRSKDDERQISRWKALAGSRGRFMRFLVTQILKKGTKSNWNDKNISPKIRQVLQHWGYKLTKKDFDIELKRRKNA